MFLQRVASLFEKEKIPYAIVGGYAVVFHGVVRGTVDIDIVTKLNIENLKKVERALHQLGLESRIPVGAEEIINFREEYMKNKNLVAWSFINPKNPTEMVDLLITNDVGEFSTEVFKVQNFDVPVIDKASLIAMKKKSGRPQDLEDIKALESFE